MVKAEKVRRVVEGAASHLNKYAGGKVKPLKAPKKDKKEEDEDDIAFKAKKAAGTLRLRIHQTEY